MNFEALIKTLESEAEIYAELLRIEKEKTEILVEGDVGKLDKLMNTEQAINMKINAVEKKRIGIMDELGLHDKTLKEVIAIAKNDESKSRTRLFNLYKNLKEYTDELKEVNDRNMTLVKARLDVITKISDFVMSDASHRKIKNGKFEKRNTNTYDKNAKVVPQESKSGNPTIKKQI